MSRRYQLLLTDRQHATLLGESVRTSVSMAELIRRAVDAVYRPEASAPVRGFEVTLGVHRERDAAMIGRLRRRFGGRRSVDLREP